MLSGVLREVNATSGVRPCPPNPAGDAWEALVADLDAAGLPGIASCRQLDRYCRVEPYARRIQASCPITCRTCHGCAFGENSALTLFNAEAEICAGATCVQAECCRAQQRCSASAFACADVQSGGKWDALVAAAEAAGLVQTRSGPPGGVKRPSRFPL